MDFACRYLSQHLVFVFGTQNAFSRQLPVSPSNEGELAEVSGRNQDNADLKVLKVFDYVLLQLKAHNLIVGRNELLGLRSSFAKSCSTSDNRKG